MFPVHIPFHLSISNWSPSSQNSSPTLSPSPHISVHVLKVIAVLFSQSNPVSIVQVAEHPSPSSVLLSSHCSPDVIKLSPQTSTQVEGVEESPPVHSHPSTLAVQSLLHLSVFSVSPSSHVSFPTFLLSPQTSVHVDGFESSPPVQFHPTTLPVHVLLHLSLSDWSPSSQNSLPTNLLSPHISVQVVNVISVLFTQSKPVSFTQVDEHPSPETVLLSSHFSSGVIKLSPHTDCHDVGFVLSPPVQL